MSWAADYIGEPWALGEHDCWGFFRRVQLEQFNRSVPIIDVDALNLLAVARAFSEHPERERWVQAAAPVEGDAVLMAHARYPSHVGVWVEADGGGVLHCQQGAGVVFSTLQALRVAGWNSLNFYHYRG